MARYGYTNVNVTLPTGGAKVFCLPADPSRVSLLVSTISGGTIGFSFTSGPNANGTYWTDLGNFGRPLTYREFGPVIQYEVYLSSLAGGNLDTYVTSIYRLPGC
jgi:hypothetical protein